MEPWKGCACPFNPWMKGWKALDLVYRRTLPARVAEALGMAEEASRPSGGSGPAQDLRRRGERVMDPRTGFWNA